MNISTSKLLVIAAVIGWSVGVEARQGDDLLVVDCLLPGQIRTLGQNTTYLSARRPTKTSARDCELRGGEYVTYDRADYATALNVWLAQAQTGDPDAQTSVGEIYERGFGGIPDYESAALWYRRAAKSGYARAQINLGNLFERGLGVERDPVEALRWYRKAAGIDAQLALAEVVVQRTVPDPRVAELETELANLARQAETLNEELTQTRDALEVARLQPQGVDPEEMAQALAEQTAAYEAELAGLEARNRADRAERERLEQERLAAIRSQTEAEQELGVALVTRDEEIQALGDLLAKLQDDLAAAERVKADRDSALAAQRRKLESAETSTSADRENLQQARTGLQVAEAALAQQAEQLRTQREELAQLRSRIAQLETERIERRETEIAAAAETEREVLSQQLLAGPTITLVDPVPALTRGEPIVRVRSGVAKRSVVGQVQAPAGLMVLTVNDAPVLANAAGVFKAEVPVTTGSSVVSIVAVDSQGKRASMDFLLESAVESAPAALPPPPADPLKGVNFGTYHALVIGNDNYQSLPDLETAINDAQHVADLLQTRFGFEVTVLEDADRYAVLSALNELRETLTRDDNLLIYYAGHGELDKVNMRGHWLPIDAEANSSANWISNVAVTDILNAMQAKQVLVVVDSCYAGTLTRSSVGRLNTAMTQAERLNWFKTMASKRSRMVLTSGGIEPVLDAGGGDHSVFAQALLDVLGNAQEIVTVQRLYEEVAARVAFAAERLRFEQVPEYAPIRFAGHESGDFFLLPR